MNVEKNLFYGSKRRTGHDCHIEPKHLITALHLDHLLERRVTHLSGRERQAGQQLVATSKGGKGGGGARVTEAGEQTISAFKKLQKKFAHFLDHESKKLDF